VFLVLAGRRFLSERAGLIAGVLLAVYPPAIYFDGLVQKAALDNVLMCALLAVLAPTLCPRVLRFCPERGRCWGYSH